MATEETKAAARTAAKAAMARKGWNQVALSRQAKIDPNTVSSFLAGSRWPTIATLGKIETALELTPGTLAGLGEDGAPPDRATLAEVEDAQLVAELGYRVEDLRRRLRDAQAQLAPLEREERRRWERRRDYLGGISEDSDGHERWIEREWNRLQFEASSDGNGWGREDYGLYEHLCDLIDALAFAVDNGMEVITGPGYPDEQHDFTTRPHMEARRGLIELSGQEWMSRPGIPLDDDPHDPIRVTDPATLTPAARHARSRGKQLQDETDAVGEESQDDGGEGQ